MSISADQGERIIFVGGVPRSGTTLLQRMLGAHPQIVAGPEMGLLGQTMALRQQFFDFAHTSRGRFFFDQERVRQHFAHFVERLLTECADRHHRAFISEKTTGHTAVLPDLMQLLPGARAILITRDPRAIVASLLRATERARKLEIQDPVEYWDLASAIWIIETLLVQLSRTQDEFPNRSFTIRFDELVTTPEKTSREVCRFLGIGWSPEMLQPGSPSAESAANVDHTFITEEMFYGPIDPDTALRWRSHLSPSIELVIRGAFENNVAVQRLGYDLGLSDVSVAARWFARSSAATIRRWHSLRRWAWPRVASLQSILRSPREHR